jgi:tyrosyl-tRNA synthetase
MLAADGTKLGKTTGARVWLDPDKTSPYEFRQYWMQVADDDVESHLLTFSLRPVDEIRSIAAQHAEAPQHRLGQKMLADDMVTLVHGAQAAALANEAAELLFGSDPTAASEAALQALASGIPHSTMASADLDDLIGVLVATELAQSNGDARRTLAQHAYSVNGVQLGENDQLSGHERLHGRYLLLRRGKKSHHLVEIIS